MSKNISFLRCSVFDFMCWSPGYCETKKKKKNPTWNNILYYLNGEKAKQFFKDIL